MRVTIDGAGRLVIPRAVRRQAGLGPGAELDVRWRDGRIELEPVPLPVDLVRTGRLLLAAPRAPTVPLSADIVERTREVLREGRSVES